MRVKEQVSVKANPKTRDRMWEVSHTLYGPKRGYVFEGVNLAFNLFIELSKVSVAELKEVCEYLSEEYDLPTFKEFIKVVKEAEEREETEE